jgi:ribosomal protein S18 acetylase RimI-like enzyme
MIRRAIESDLEDIKRLLNEVLNVHALIRPDLFKANTRKYTDKELLDIIKDDNSPILVYEGGHKILGHAFLKIEENKETNNMYASKTLYIDDICVDSSCRGKHIGSLLLDYIKEYAIKIKCNYITLNVWEGNNIALEFYKKNGFTNRKYNMEIKLD